jgi:hypothetical protein
MQKRIGHLAVVFVALAVGLPAQVQPQPGREASSIRVPFVGCKSDGLAGPKPAPVKAWPWETVWVDAKTAKSLAYYKAEMSLGVLAPRGWYCFGTYGTNGSNLFVAPQPVKRDDLFSARSHSFTGPFIQVTFSYGGTSGRFSVARTIARVFPSRKAFVQHVIDEGFETASDFPFGPFPKDKPVFQSDQIVEYQTPPHSEGLGTMSWLEPDGDPVESVAILTGSWPDMVHLAVRLPAGLRDLTPHIVRQVEGDYADKNTDHQAGGQRQEK